MEHAASRPLLLSLPNMLTMGRILAVPAMAASFLLVRDGAGRWLALGIYLVACITDWLDGHLARIWRQQSALGRMMDPIADKLLVGTALLLLVYDNTINGWTIWAAIIILCREILVSGLREFLAELNKTVRVSQLAKWKTMLQMVALGVLIAGPAGDRIVAGITMTGTALLWVAATLTLYTGYDYLKAAIVYALEE
jgi:CDP-diacylglycerol--glycerol-3-phosphate 3-phosphatidyltransferase/cardiolipin synthase